MKSRGSFIRLRRFEVDERRRKVADIETMLVEFERMAADLDEQIQAEQDRVGVTDIAHYAYPTFAKAAMQRRDNIRASIDDLRVQLVSANEELAKACEEFKRAELISGRAKAAEQAVEAAYEQSEMDRIALSISPQK